MLKKIVIVLGIPLLSLLIIAASLSRSALGSSPLQAGSTVASVPATGTLQKMIVENGSVTMDLDLNAFEGSGSLVARPVTLQFVIGANSFFPILVFNDLLRGPQPGSMALIPQAGANVPGYSNLPVALGASLKQLVIEKRSSDQRYDLAVRDSNTGFTFFNVEGGEYDYDANAQSLSIRNGRLLISKEFANALGRPSEASAVVGKISVGAAMQPIEITELANGEAQSTVMPAVGTQPGPDVIVGIVEEVEQFGSFNNSVGLGRNDFL